MSTTNYNETEYKSYSAKIKISLYEELKRRGYNFSAVIRDLLDIVLDNLEKDSTLKIALSSALKSKFTDLKFKCKECNEICNSKQGLLKHISITGHKKGL